MLLNFQLSLFIPILRLNGGLPSEKSPTSAAYNVGGQLTANITDSIPFMVWQIT
jgi:hypothetical protein